MMSIHNNRQDLSSQCSELEGILFSKSPKSQGNNSYSFIASPKTQFFSKGNPLPSDHAKKYQSFHSQSRSGNRTQEEELQHLIGEISFPHDTISVTSFTNSSRSSSTPTKSAFKSNGPSPKHYYSNPAGENGKPPPARTSSRLLNKKIVLQKDGCNKENVNINKPFYFDGSASAQCRGTAKDSFSSDKVNKFIDWSKTHVTVGGGRMIFPQIIAPSIEISCDNSQGKLQAIQEDLSNEKLALEDGDEQHAARSEINGHTTSAGPESARLRITNHQLTEQLEQRESEYTLQLNLRKKLEQENSHLSQRISEQQEHMEFLQGKYRDRTSLGGLRGKNLENAKLQIKQLKSLLEKKEDKILGLSATLQRHQTAEECLKRSIDKEIKSLQQTIAHQNSTAKSQSLQAESLKQQNNDIKQNMESAAEQASSKLQENVAFLSRELASRDAKISQLSRDYSLLKDEQHRNFESQIEHRDRLQKQALQELEHQNEQLTAQLKQLSMQKESLTCQLHAARACIAKPDPRGSTAIAASRKNAKSTELQGLLELESIHEIQEAPIQHASHGLHQVAVETYETSKETQCNLALEAVEHTLISISLYDSGLSIDQCLLKIETEYLKLKEKYGKMNHELANQRTQQERLSTEQERSLRECEQAKKALCDLQNVRRAKEPDSKLSLATSVARSASQESDLLTKCQEQLESLRERMTGTEKEHESCAVVKQDLENKVNALEIELKVLGYEAQRTKEECSTVNAHKDKAIVDLRAKSEEVSQALKRRITDLEQRNLLICSELKQKEELILEQREQLNTTHTQHELEQSLGLLNKKVSERAERKPSSLNEQFQELNRDLLSKEHTITSLKHEVNDLQTSLEQERQHNSDANKAHEERCQRSKDHTRSLESDNMRYLKQCQELRNKLKAQGLQLERDQQHTSSLRIQLEHAELKLKESNNKTQQLAAANSELEKDNKQYKLQLEAVESEYREVEGHMSKQTTKLELRIQELELNCRALQPSGKKQAKDQQCEEFWQAQELLHRKETEVKSLTDKLKACENKKRNIEADLANKTVEVSKLEQKLVEAEQASAASIEEIADLSKQLENKDEIGEVNRVKLAGQEKHISQLETTIEQSRWSNKEKVRENLDLANQNKNLQERVRVLQEVNTAIKAELDKKGRAIAQRNSEANALNAASEKFELEHCKLNNWNEEQSNIILRLESEVSMLKSRLELISHDDSQCQRTQLESKWKDYTQQKKEEDTCESIEEMRGGFQHLLIKFEQRETESEHIRSKLLEKVMFLSEQFTMSEKRLILAMEENAFHNHQLVLQNRSVDILREKVRTLQSYTNHELSNTSYETERDRLAVLSDRDHLLLSQDRYHGRQGASAYTDELYNPNKHKEMQRPQRLCPEILSAKEPVLLVVDALQRTGHNSNLAHALRENANIKGLAKAAPGGHELEGDGFVRINSPELYRKRAEQPKHSGNTVR